MGQKGHLVTYFMQIQPIRFHFYRNYNWAGAYVTEYLPAHDNPANAQIILDISLRRSF